MFHTLTALVRARYSAKPGLLGALLSDIAESERYPEYLLAIVAEHGGTPEEALAAHLERRAQVVGWC